MTNKEQSTQRERELKIQQFEASLKYLRNSLADHINRDHPNKMPISCHTCPGKLALIRGFEESIQELQD